MMEYGNGLKWMGQLWQRESPVFLVRDLSPQVSVHFLMNLIATLDMIIGGYYGCLNPLDTVSVYICTCAPTAHRDEHIYTHWLHP